MTITYKAPLKDITFIIKDVLNVESRIAGIPAYADSSWEVSSDILATTASYAEKIALPLNPVGDAEGCTHNPADGSVKTPTGFKEAYDKFRETGMIGLTGIPDFGGFGMPHYLSMATNEVLTSANFSLCSYGGLTAGAAKVLEHFATDEIKAQYLPKMYSGEWTGTMCLTEPQAGSDLGLITSKAEPQADGSFKISGNKIFITGGEHDMADNICHLVLARLPGAPAGTKGISLFLVPKNAVNADGSAGEKNGVLCTSIEHKMGIHGSSTCSISFEDSTGYMIGNPNEGLKAMFTMMNDARLKVAMQGLSISETVCQNAISYAAIRVQGVDVKDTFNKNAQPVPILNHANVRKDIIDMKSQIEGFRALAYEAAIQLDIAEKHPDAETRKQADAVASLLTPILKSCLTDLGCATAQKSIQLHGGMGFITETGIEQFYRDAIIGTIYEGTNDIQSMDFTFRKAGYIAGYLKSVQEDLVKMQPTAEVQAVGKSLAALGATAQGLAELGKQGKVEDILVHSRDFLDMFGKVAVGHMWLKIMATADAKMAADPADAAYYETRKLLGENFINRIMAPEVKKLQARITAGAGAVTKLDKINLVA